MSQQSRSVQDNVDQESQEMVRPLRTIGKPGKGEKWSCFPVYYPLDKVIRAFCIFDICRGLFDTLSVIMVLVYVVGIEYEKLSLAHSNTHKAVNASLNADTREQAKLYFYRSKRILVKGLALSIPVFLFEVPLAAFLLRSLPQRKRERFNCFIQTSSLLIIVNHIVSIGLFLYSNKLGIIRDDLASEYHLALVIYDLVFRTAVFDLTKGAEIIFVNVHLNENRRRVTWHEESIRSNRTNNISTR